VSFRLGVNLPWLDYGLDFGANAWQPQGGVASRARRARLEAVCQELSERGCGLVRWFLIGDGRAGVRFAADGTPVGLDDRFFADADHAIATLDRHRLRVLFVLVDFLWFRRARSVNGVRLGGHARTVSDAGRRGRLIESVFAPIFARYGQEPVVWGWDLCNEPEWAVRRVAAHPASTVRRRDMTAFLREAAACAHEYAVQPVTVGLASLRGLGLVRSAGLDLYQVHWYDALQRRAPLETPVDSLGLDRPVLLGEFPTRGSRRAPSDIVAAARRAGYTGALAWSVLAEDRASDFASAADQLRLQRRT
jgi:hypothetical protein